MWIVKIRDPEGNEGYLNQRSFVVDLDQAEVYRYKNDAMAFSWWFLGNHKGWEATLEKWT